MKSKRRLTLSEERFLKAQKVVRISTLQGDGSIHSVPICPVFDGSHIYFETAPKSKKVRNLEVDARITVIADQYYDDWSKLKTLMLQGKAQIIHGGKEFQYAKDLLYKKFPQFPASLPIEEGKNVIVKVTLQLVMGSVK